MRRNERAERSRQIVTVSRPREAHPAAQREAEDGEKNRFRQPLRCRWSCLASRHKLRKWMQLLYSWGRGPRPAARVRAVREAKEKKGALFLLPFVPIFPPSVIRFSPSGIGHSDARFPAADRWFRRVKRGPPLSRRESCFPPPSFPRHSARLVRGSLLSPPETLPEDALQLEVDSSRILVFSCTLSFRLFRARRYAPFLVLSRTQVAMRKERKRDGEGATASATLNAGGRSFRFSPMTTPKLRGYLTTLRKERVATC